MGSVRFCLGNLVEGWWVDGILVVLWTLEVIRGWLEW